MLKAPIKIRINNWAELVELSSILSYSYVFRGQQDSSWELASALERTLKKSFPIPIPQICQYVMDNREYWMLREFKRKFHLYSNERPAEEDNFEWLAIMQHHGCPTRLLDFSHSIYVATYFAVLETNTDSAIWCLNTDESYFKNFLAENYDVEFDKIHLGDKLNDEYIKLCNLHIGNDITCDKKLILPIETKRFSKRMSNQQGLFIAPLNPKSSFMENFCETYMISDDYDPIEMSLNDLAELDDEADSFSYIKLIISSNLRQNFISHLRRMNITCETIYPGLDGFSKSLIETVVMDNSLISELKQYLKKKNNSC